MGVISTPPRPAAANCSSWCVRLALSTALPGHHQRVQGLFSRESSGHPGSAAWTNTAMDAKANASRRRGVRMGEITVQDASGASTERWVGQSGQKLIETPGAVRAV